MTEDLSEAAAAEALRTQLANDFIGILTTVCTEEGGEAKVTRGLSFNYYY